MRVSHMRFLLALPLPTLAFCSELKLEKEALSRIGLKIWQNESRGTSDGLISWNPWPFHLAHKRNYQKIRRRLHSPHPISRRKMVFVRSFKDCRIILDHHFNNRSHFGCHCKCFHSITGR